jgi:hypothetical protein
VVRADVAYRIGRVDAACEQVEVVLLTQPLEVGDRAPDRGRGRR